MSGEPTPGSNRRPRKTSSLSRSERLLIETYLAYHREAAKRGLNAIAGRLGSSPISAADVGMTLRFSTLLSLIDDMTSQLGKRQRWIPLYRAVSDSPETAPCPPGN